MALKGQTGGSLGGGIVGRKQLKAQQQPVLSPVDPRTLNAEARARREAYAAEAEARKQASIAAQEERVRRQAADRAAAAAKGKRVIPLGNGVLTHAARQGQQPLSKEERDAAARARVAKKKADSEAKRRAGVKPQVVPKMPRSQKGAPVVKWKNTARENGL